MYCVSIRTLTNIGFGYDLGTWDSANVKQRRLRGSAAQRLLPEQPGRTTDRVNGVTTTADQRAAIHAAIWYFSDNFVLSPADPLQAAVASIVNTVRRQPPLPAPAPPSLQITPLMLTGDVDTVVGPFIVTTDDPTGGRRQRNRCQHVRRRRRHDADHQPHEGPRRDSDLAPWSGRRHRNAEGPRRLARPTGNVFLYSGNIVDVNDAHRLILAQHVIVTANAGAVAVFTQTTTAPSTSTSTSTTASSTTSTTAAVGPAITVPAATTTPLPATGSSGRQAAQIALAVAVMPLGACLVALTRHRQNSH